MRMLNKLKIMICCLLTALLIAHSFAATINNSVNNFANIDNTTKTTLRANTLVPFQPITETGTTRDIGVTDTNAIIYFTNTSASISAYLQTDTAAPISNDAQIMLINNSTSQTLALTPGDGVIITSPTANNDGAGGGAMVGPGGYILARKITANTWRVMEVYDKFTTTTNTWSGIWSSSQSVQYTITRWNGIVFFSTPDVTASATIAANITASVNVPSRFLNGTSNYYSVIVLNNGTNQSSLLQINSAGVITQYGTATRGSFSGTGTSGIQHNQVSWLF